MSEPIVTAEAVTREVFDQTIVDLQTRIDGLASKSAIDDLQARVGDLVGMIERFDGHVNARFGDIEKRISEEETTRASAIRTVSDDLQKIGQSTENKLHEIDRKIDSRLDAIQTGIAHITGRMESFQAVIDGQQAMYCQQADELARHRGTISDIKRTQGAELSAIATMGQRVDDISKTIYGGADDRKSLIGTIDELARTINASMTTQNAQIGTLATRINEHQQALASIKESIESDKRRWDARKTAVKKLLSGVGKSRGFWAVLATGLAGLSIGSIPDLADFFRWLVGGE